MFKHTQWQKTISLLMILSVCPFFAACGGDEDGDNNTSSPTNSGGSSGGGLVCLAYLLVSGDDECLSWGASSSSSSSGSVGKVIRYTPYDEIEPNNDLLNANPLSFPSSEDLDGFIVDGSVHDVSDQTDLFTFVRASRHDFEFQLCAHGQRSCDQPGEIDTLTAYFDILNQSGSVVTSTQASSRNSKQMRIEAGTSYYIRVVAGDTMATTVKYELKGRELN